MKFDLRHELHVGMIHVNIWGKVSQSKQRADLKALWEWAWCVPKQTEGLLGWTEINKGDTCMKVNSRRRQGSHYICLCRPRWGFCFYSACNGKPSEEISWYHMVYIFKKVALANVENMYGVYIELEDSGHVLKVVQENFVQKILFLVIWLWTNCLTSPQCSHL